MLPKALVLGAIIVAGIVAFLFLLDLITSFFMDPAIPFKCPSRFADVLFVLSAGAILYLGYETYREVA